MTSATATAKTTGTAGKGPQKKKTGMSREIQLFGEAKPKPFK